MKIQVGIVMGSDSDLPIMKKAAHFLEKMEIGYELTIVSAHRTPEKLFEYAKTARSRNLKVIIAGAGGAAHLPGMLAANTSIPIIGVPIKTSTLNGIDSLYSIVQMPAGIPVATVAINGAENAGILASSILGITDPEIYERVHLYKMNLKQSVEEKALQLESIGYEKYLEAMGNK